MSQLALWPGQNGRTYNIESTTHSSSKQKPQKQHQPRVRKAVTTAGVVASFPTPQEKGDLLETLPSMAEARTASNEGDYALASEGSPDNASASSPSPSSAPPPSGFHPDIVAFWPTCNAEPALHDLIAAHKESQVLAVIGYVQGQKCDSPKGLARTLLEQNFMPPGAAPVTLPTYIPKPDDFPSITWSDDSTESDNEDTEPADLPQIEPEALMAWNSAYSQLEVQLDRGSFDTWLRGAWLYQVEGQKFTIAVPNKYAADMLQYRMIRDIRRIVEEVYEQPVELVFVVEKPRMKPEGSLPLFKLLAQRPDVQPEQKGWVA